MCNWLWVCVCECACVCEWKRECVCVTVCVSVCLNVDAAECLSKQRKYWFKRRQHFSQRISQKKPAQKFVVLLFFALSNKNSYIELCFFMYLTPPPLLDPLESTPVFFRSLIRTWRLWIITLNKKDTILEDLDCGGFFEIMDWSFNRVDEQWTNYCCKCTPPPPPPTVWSSAVAVHPTFE